LISGTKYFGETMLICYFLKLIELIFKCKLLLSKYFKKVEIKLNFEKKIFIFENILFCFFDFILYLLF